MKISENFYLQEFVGRKIYERFGAKAMQFIDMRLVNLAQFYRSTFGKTITINNWHDGGTFNERGFREPGTNTGAGLSQHKFGRAFDCNIAGLNAGEAFNYIMQYEQKFYDAGLRAVEDVKFTTGWLHSDIRNTEGYNIGTGKILIVKP